MRLTASALCLTTFFACAAQAQTAKPSPAQAYEACTQKAASAPAQALRDSEAWLKSGPTSAAYHCKALALFYLKRFTESAELLEYLASTLPRESRRLWVNIMRQASVARVHAGMADKAMADLNLALAYVIDQDMPDAAVELLLDRSRLYAARDFLMEAVQDADHALTLSPGNGKVLLERARVLRMAGKYELAREDLQQILKAEPGNAEALSALQSLPRLTP